MSRKRLAFLVALVLCLTASLPVVSQSGSGHDLTWFTIDGGGATLSQGGSFSLNGTIGQADAGTLGGGSYTLVGGFWGASVLSGGAAVDNIYLPVILRQS